MKSDGSEITQVDQLSYARVHGRMCPYCGGKDLDISRTNEFEKVYEENREMIRQRAECENCGRAWWDCFMLSHIEELKEVIHDETD
jgi:YgiT-type zinc finger domain-containing protein